MRSWLLAELSLRLERFGYALVHTAKRIEAAAINACVEQPSFTDGSRRSKLDLSGSPAMGESGGRRWLKPAMGKGFVPESAALDQPTHFST